ncbi:hypothetical protein IFM12276_45610 [Nocardia sputorum]|uniref:RDD domain-containing protein n=2 Tax=Nocardiaceae TaxID=85025 RepID=A0ABM8D2G1_9NOCA|nr:hypothetical protein IFM12276_45610 [Nocardia sputorum]
MVVLPPPRRSPTLNWRLCGPGRRFGRAYPGCMARITGSWLSGPPADSGGPATSEFPGAQLGLPKTGAGSLAGMGRRIAALFVDWLIALGIAALITRSGSASSLTLLIWFVIGVGAVTLFGFTPGQYFLRLRTVRIDAPAPVGFVRALARQVLLLFVVPALFTDADGRGMHDRATGTALVRSR